MLLHILQGSNNSIAETHVLKQVRLNRGRYYFHGPLRL
jgi:hypothetical protein